MSEFFSADSSDVEYLFSIPNSSIFAGKNASNLSKNTESKIRQINSKRSSVSAANHTLNTDQQLNSILPTSKGPSITPYHSSLNTNLSLLNQNGINVSNSQSILTNANMYNYYPQQCQQPNPNYVQNQDNQLMPVYPTAYQPITNFSSSNYLEQSMYLNNQVPQIFPYPDQQANTYSMQNNSLFPVQKEQIVQQEKPKEHPTKARKEQMKKNSSNQQNAAIESKQQNENLKINKNSNSTNNSELKNPETSNKTTEKEQFTSEKTKQNQIQNEISSQIETRDEADVSSLDKKIIYPFVLSIIKNHGIGGSRLFLSDYMQEVGKRIIIHAYCNLPIEFKKMYRIYLRHHFPLSSQLLNRLCFKGEEDDDNELITSLIKEEEHNVIQSALNQDFLYAIALYISNEKLPDNFQFAPEMQTPNGWTAIDDFVAVTACPFVNKLADVLYDEKLPFKKFIQIDEILIEFIENRLKVILDETINVFPLLYHIYEKTDGTKLTPKTFGNIESFLKLNSHVAYPKKLTISFQKKILRILYLYGIPNQNGIEKITNILGYKSVEYESIKIFVIKILIKCLKYQPELIELLKTLPRVEGRKLKNNDFVNINWINEKAIESIASNVYVIYKVRENYSWFDKIDFVHINIGKWNEITSMCSWWNYGCDKNLFKITAYYGFLFNSIIYIYISNAKPDYELFHQIREKEIVTLSPNTTHPSLKFLGPVLFLENKKKRIIEILNAIENTQKNNQ